jgi:hypothetical protein
MTRQFSAIAEAAVLLVAVLLAPQAASAQAWQDDFDWPSLDPRWTLAGWGAPGYISGNHIGSYDANNVSLQSGYLVLRLTQTSGQVDNNPDGVLSSGALVATTDTFGYGTTALMSGGCGCPPPPPTPPEWARRSPGAYRPASST